MPRESTIQIFRSSTTQVPTGLTFGELALSDVTGLQRLYAGVNNGATGAIWIGAPITGASAAISNSGTVSDLVPTVKAVKDYVDGIVGGGSVVNSLNGQAGAITITGNGSSIVFSQVGAANTIGARLASTSVTGVASFNSSDFSVDGAGSVTLVNVARTNAANTFTSLQTFNAGITANNLWVSQGATFAGLLNAAAGLTTVNIWATGATFTGNLHANVIRGSQLNVQNTGNNLLGDVTGVLGGGYIQVDNSSGIAVNKIVGTVYTNQILAGGAVSVTGAISSTSTITATGRMSNAGMTATGPVAITSSLTADNLWVTNGVTFASTSVHTGLATFNAGTTSNNLWVTNGATFGGVGINVSSGGISVTGGIAGTLVTAAQPNITSVGTLTSITTSGLGTFNAGTTSNNLWVSQGATFGGVGINVSSGGISVTGGIAGTLVTAAQPNITSVGTLSSITTSGLGTFNAGITANNLWVSQGATFGGVGINVSSGGISVTGGIAGTLVTAAQTNITSLGSLTTLTSAGLTATQRVTVNSGGILVNAGGLSVTGGANITGGATIAGPFTVLGGIPNAQLQNSSVSIVGGASSTLSLGGTLTITGVGNNIVVSNSSNTVTLSLANDIVIPGNLTVNGTVVTANVDTFIVEDPMFMLGTGNAADSVDLGFYGQYTSGGRRFTGLFRDASDGKFRLFAGLSGDAEPTTTVNIGGTGFAITTLIANIDGGTF